MLTTLCKCSPAVASLAFSVVCAQAQPITPAMRAADSRLEKSVSIVEREIWLGDLLEYVSKQSGVAVRLDPDDGGANALVTISASKMSLADLMDSLWSVSSFQKAEWEWARSGNPGSYSYKLLRPGPARDLPERLKKKVQSDFSTHVARLEEAAKLTDAGREKLASERASYDIPSQRTMAGLNIFTSALSADDQRAVLLDGESRRVDTSTLSPAAQQFIIRWANAILPPYVEFSVQRYDDSVAPSLYMVTPNAGGYNYAGGVPLGLAEASALEASWQLSGDTRSSELDKRTVKVTERPGEISFNNPGADPFAALSKLPLREQEAAMRRSHRELEPELVDLSQSAAIPVIALLSPGQHSGKMATGDTVSAYLSRVNPNYVRQVMVKWRNGAMLLCSPSWFYHSEERMPWSKLTELRRIANEGLPLAPLLRVLERVTTAQMAAASDEFPFFKRLLPAQNLFALYYKYPQILAAQGLPITADCLESIRTAVSAPDVDWARPMTLYVREAATSDGATLTKNIMFELDLKDGTTVWAKPVQIRDIVKPSASEKNASPLLWGGAPDNSLS